VDFLMEMDVIWWEEQGPSVSFFILFFFVYFSVLEVASDTFWSSRFFPKPHSMY
jgi:hypothetical protein